MKRYRWPAFAFAALTIGSISCCQSMKERNALNAPLPPSDPKKTMQPDDFREAPAVAAKNAKDPGRVDLESKPLPKIPVGTVIGDTVPQGWTNLVLFATPKFEEQDRKDAPSTAAYYAEMFKFVLLARVDQQESGKRHYLQTLARGFAIDRKGQQTIVTGDNTLGANVGTWGALILSENEKMVNDELRQVARTDTMLMFDAMAIMRQPGPDGTGKVHTKMVMRHAAVVEPTTGKLRLFVWLLAVDGEGYRAAESGIQMLPEGMREDRFLSVDRSKIGLIGIPERDAFALVRIPQGTAIPYGEAWKSTAVAKTFTAEMALDLEAELRSRIK